MEFCLCVWQLGQYTLEKTGDISTDSFTLVLRGFISLWGPIDTIWSDSGTKFIGAERVLANALKKLDQTLISSELNRCSIEWKFNSPSSSWMGGVRESLVKSARRSLKVITRDKSFYRRINLYVLMWNRVSYKQSPIDSKKW